MCPVSTYSKYLFYFNLYTCICEQRKRESEHVSVYPWVTRVLLVTLHHTSLGRFSLNPKAAASSLNHPYLSVTTPSPPRQDPAYSVDSMDLNSDLHTCTASVLTH